MKLIALISIIFFHSGIIAQVITSFDSLDKKSKKEFTSAKHHIKKKESDQAINHLTEILTKYPNFYEARYLLGGEYYKNDDPIKAINEFQYLLKLKTPPDAKLLYLLSELYEKQKDLDQAINHLQAIDRHMIKDSVLWNTLQNKVHALIFRRNAYDNPLNVNPIKLGPQINGPYGEYMPSFIADGSELVFTKRVAVKNASSHFVGTQEDLYFSLKDSTGNYSEAEPLINLNTSGNEGTHCLSQDGNILIFTACDGEYRQNGCDLYISFRKYGQWSKAINMGDQINSRYWESHPSLSYDNKTLYFSSTRKGGYGKSDIWKVELIEGGWSDPINLGPSINTKGDEQSPFIHPDDETLYFRSDTHIGMGGFDLFVSLKTNNGWTTPVNLGYPINTDLDESALFVDIKGEKAYYSTGDVGTSGNYDIYSFELPKQFKPKPVSYLSIKVLDAETKSPLSSEINLMNVNDKTKTRKLTTDHQGQSISIIQKAEYLLTVSKQSYLFFSDQINIISEADIDKPYLYSIELTPITEKLKKDSLSFTPRNIFFESGSSVLMDKSKNEIENLFDLLVSNPKYNMSIVGHTDNIGEPIDNQMLSEARAKAVYTELVQMGINSKRLTYLGKGEEEPITTNLTPEGRSKNRRTQCILHLIANK